MKLHLGCGDKRFDGFINVDKDPNADYDVLIDLETEKWIWEDNSIDEIIVHHLLEHLGDGYFHFLQEMYRVCKPDAIIEIVVPHPRHDVFLNDPTHKRPITLDGLRLFSQSYNRDCKRRDDGASRLGIYYGVDFDIVDFKMNFDGYWAPMLEKEMTPEHQKEIQHAIRSFNNVIVDVMIKLIVVKEYSYDA